MVGAVSGIRSAFISGVSGIRSATGNLAKHAANVARGSVVAYEDRVELSSAGRALAIQAEQARGAAEARPSIEESLVGEIVAGHDLAANVASLRTANEMMAKLVRLGDRDR
jgi:hypothetical protein